MNVHKIKMKLSNSKNNTRIKFISCIKKKTLSSKVLLFWWAALKPGPEFGPSQIDTASSRLQRDTQVNQLDAPYLLGNLSDRLDAGSIQVVVVLSRFNKSVVLNVLLHLLSGHNEVVVSAVHLIVPLWSGCV